MSTARKLGIAAGVVAALAAVAAIVPLVALPRQVQVERSIVVDAPACNVHGLLTGFARYNEWSPWAEIDPAGTKYTYEGPSEGVGASMSWSSPHPDVGDGSQTITASEPCARVVTQMQFGDAGAPSATWLLTPEGAGTKVVWTLEMDMGNNPIGRLFGTQMDGMIGPDFEKGLAKLKALSESLPKEDVAGLTVEAVDVPSVPAAMIRTVSAKDPASVGATLGSAYGEIQTWLAPQGLAPSGPPLATYAPDEQGYAILAVLPLPSAPTAPPTGNVQVGTTPGGKALKVVHTGSYATIEATQARLNAWMALRNLTAVGAGWEEYVSDPATTPEAEVVTNLYVPVP